MKKILFIYILLGFFGASCFSQTNEREELVKDTSAFSNLDLDDQEMFQFSVSTGMSFSSFGKGFNSTGTYVYPSASMKINNKLNLDIGTYFLKSNFSGFSADNNMKTPGLSFQQSGVQSTSGFVNAKATYEVSKNINVTGFMMKGFGNNNQLLQNSYNNLSLMGIGVNYEILPNLSIGAQFNYYNAPSFHSPYSSGFYQPFAPGNHHLNW